MKLKLRYLLAGVLVTAAFAWDVFQLPVGGLSFVFFLLALFLVGISAWSSTVPRPWFRQWNAITFFRWLRNSFVLVLILVLLSEIPADREHALWNEWHFIGALWLLLLSVLAVEYLEEKQEQKAAAGSEAASQG